MQEDTITREQFAQLFIFLLKQERTFSKRTVTADAETFSATAKKERGCDALTFSLEKIYSSYKATADADKLQLLIRHIWLCCEAAPIPAKQTIERKLKLFPSVRAQTTYDVQNWKLKATNQQAAVQIPCLPYAGQFAVGLIYDNGESLAHVTDLDLANWNLSLKTAMDMAVENLRSISNEKFRQVQPGLYVSPWQDFHDSARLLLPEIVKSLAVDGDIVAMVPTANTLFITGSQDHVGLDLMLSLSMALMDDRLSILGMPVRLKNDNWEILTVAPTDLIAERVNVYRLNILKCLYDDQEKLIQSGFSSQRVDKITAPFSLQRDDKYDLVYSRTCAIEGHPDSLPLSDFVEFHKVKDKGTVCVAKASMPEVMQVLKSNIRLVESLYPPRFELACFPNENELKALGMKTPQKFVQRFVIRGDIAPLEVTLSVRIPPKSKPVGSIERSENGVEQWFEVEMPQDQVVPFYMEQFKTGFAEKGTDDKQKIFFRVSSFTAGMKRVAWIFLIEPGRSSLKLSKTVDHHCAGILTALKKQSSDLSLLEQLFGISFYPDSTLSGILRFSGESVSQDLWSADDAQRILEYYQIQMTGPNIAMIRSGSSTSTPAILTDRGSGITVTIKLGRETLVNISRKLSIRPGVA